MMRLLPGWPSLQLLHMLLTNGHCRLAAVMRSLWTSRLEDQRPGPGSLLRPGLHAADLRILQPQLLDELAGDSFARAARACVLLPLVLLSFRPPSTGLRCRAAGRFASCAATMPGSFASRTASTATVSAWRRATPTAMMTTATCRSSFNTSPVGLAPVCPVIAAPALLPVVPPALPLPRHDAQVPFYASHLLTAQRASFFPCLHAVHLFNGRVQVETNDTSFTTLVSFTTRHFVIGVQQPHLKYHRAHIILNLHKKA